MVSPHAVISMVFGSFFELNGEVYSTTLLYSLLGPQIMTNVLSELVTVVDPSLLKVINEELNKKDPPNGTDIVRALSEDCRITSTLQ